MDPKEFDPKRPAHAITARGIGDHARMVYRKWRGLNWPWRALGWVAIALFVAWLVLFVTKGRFLKHSAERIMTGMFGRDVKVGGEFNFYFNPVTIQFRADGMTIANPAWAGEKPFFTARSLEMRVAPLPLLWGRRTIENLRLDNGAIDLEWARDGKANSWTFGSGPPKTLDLPDIRRASIVGTRVHYADPRMLLFGDYHVGQVEARDTQVADSVQFTGGGTLRGQPYVVDGRLLSPNMTIAGGENRLTLAASSGATHLDVTGTLPGPTRLEGSKLQVAARGPNLARLFDFLGVAVPDTRFYNLHAALTKQGDEWRFTRLGGHYGDSDLAGRMTISKPKDRVFINTDLKTDQLHMIDIAPFVGYQSDRLEKEGGNGLITRVNGTPRILPDAPLRIDAVRAFDAKVNYEVRTVVGKNVPISNIGLALDLDHGKMSLSPLTFMMSGGLFAADVVINARGAPVTTDYDIRLSPTPMGKLLARWGVEESGTTGTIRGRIQMRGFGNTVRESLATSSGRIAIVIPQGAMWARNIQLSELDIGVFVQKLFEKKLTEPVDINCGLIAFTVRDGVASADPILIDTKKNVILGRGAFNFKDESLDLAVRADGKKFSLFSGQSPIGIGGHFAAPSIDPISPELIARGGTGVGLGAVLSPFAAILAFIDVGDAKSAACGPVLAGAHASAQRTSKGKPRDDVGRGTPSKREDGR
ncbi:MAG: AsmA family protein [Sphingobium sp.]|nr:AsmA family protein [Sphingobium sp.]